MCEHLQQPLANYSHYYHSKKHTEEALHCRGTALKKLQAGDSVELHYKADGVSEHEQRFSKTKDYLTHINFRLRPLQNNFWCYVEKQTQRCS